LRRDLWVPDILNHEDDLADPSDVVAEAARRIEEPNEPFDVPVIVPVPKSPYFPRNSTNLSLVDRIAYHAVVLSFAKELERSLTPSVYSARLEESGARRFLKSGRNAWVRWKTAVLKASTDEMWVAETDITGFFDFIKHELLIPEIEALGVNGKVLSALREMLRTWTTTVNTGLPQGPDASRALGNFYMVPVDRAMEGLPGVSYLRYMDDIRIIGPKRADVVRALHVLDAECRRRGLALSTKKTEIREGGAARKAWNRRPWMICNISSTGQNEIKTTDHFGSS